MSPQEDTPNDAPHGATPDRRRPADGWIALGAGGIGFVLVLVMLRHGIALGPDAWTYWTASSAMAHGHGYVDAHGLPVVDWPPLYPAWLALVQSALGVSIASVRLADATTLAIAAFGFTFWALRRVAPTPSAPRWPAAAFVVAFLLLLTRGIAWHGLMLALLASTLLTVDALRAARTSATQWLWSAVIAFLAAACCLTHHVGLALSAALVVPLCLPLPDGLRASSSSSTSQHGLARSGLIAGVLATATGIVAWWTSRQILGQSGSQEWFANEHGAWHLLWHATKHVGRNLGPFPVGIVTFFVALFCLRRRQRDAVAYAVAALTLLLTMFFVARVADLPGDRFVGFAALMIGALAIAGAATLERRRLRWVLLALLVLPPVIHGGKHVGRGRKTATTIHADGGVTFLPPNATFLPGVEPDATLPDGRRNVAAPLFSWQAARLERGEGRK
ncbi:MAG: hypothetical protein NXI31_10885 [bacterium]|nr:hypothetical protein [bacterium]